MDHTKEPHELLTMTIFSSFEDLIVKDCFVTIHDVNLLPLVTGDVQNKEQVLAIFYLQFS